MNIIALVESFGIFADESCTITRTSFPYGDIKQGESKVLMAYVKNTGERDIDNVLIVTSLPTEYGTAIVNNNNFPLAAGDSMQISITVTIDVDCPEGDTQFDVSVTCS